MKKSKTVVIEVYRGIAYLKSKPKDVTVIIKDCDVNESEVK